MLFIRANTLFNIHTPSIHLISPSILHPSDITIHPSSYPHVPACTLAPVAFYPSFCQLMHKQPPGHHSGIPASVPRRAMCTTGMPMLALPSSSPLVTCCMSPNAALSSIFALSPAEQACSPSVPCLSANFLFGMNSVHVPLIT